MKKEELIKPRYKVIADYPNSEWKLGKILVRVKDATNDIFHVQEYAIVGGISLNEIKKYPHIFKPLEWWEEREEKDMPEYVVDKESSSVMYKVFGWANGNCQFYFAETKCYLTWTEYFLPATKEEYESQTKIQ